MFEIPYINLAKLMKIRMLITHHSRLCFLLFTAVSIALGACRKDKNDTSDKETLLKDSVYLYTREVYLWQDVLPANFSPRQYSRAETVLEALKKYKIDPETQQPVDRYSFLDRERAVSEEVQEGVLGDFGLDVRYEAEDDLRVKLVYEGSPAGRAGIERSWKVLKINGNANIGYNAMATDDFNFLFNALSAETIKLSLQKPDGSQAEIDLNKAVYSINPVLHFNVYQRAGKKIGYLVFNNFVAITNKNIPTAAKAKIDEAFGAFENAGVTELIVDLRYNGGGSVATSEYLSNLLAPAAANGELMYSYRLNKTLTSYTQTDPDYKKAFASVNFAKLGTLNLNRIVFIVTQGSTASASELLINNLKPYVQDVKLVGEKSTLGKPVGFFPIPIFDTDLYAVSFETLNALGQGEYYQGIKVDRGGQVFDDLTRKFGDENEACLATALAYSQNGNFPALASVKTSASAKGKSVTSSISLNKALDGKGNKNMFVFPGNK